jgi:hypothetical protein
MMRSLRPRILFRIQCVSLLLVSATLAPAQPAGDAKTFPVTSQFLVKWDGGAIVSLKPAGGENPTEFIASGQHLGEILIKYRQGTDDWHSVNTAALSSSTDDNEHGAAFQILDGTNAMLAVQSQFIIEERAIIWTLTLRNTTSQPLEIGDLALPLPISRGGRQGNEGQGGGGPVILKHSFISGHGSFLFWMRSDSAPPFLTLVPTGDTHLEFWENSGGFGSGARGYNVFIHSTATGAEAATHGAKWRQSHTSLTLAPKGRRGATCSYAFKFRWADSYDGVRQILANEGGIDTQVVPGMTVSSDLFAEIALRTKQKINAVEAEFPDNTMIKSLGTKGDYQLYKIQFSKLGENRLTVRYANNRHMYLEFFSTEPLETLIKKRGAFLAHSQHRDPAKWYDGLITDWNMRDKKLISPDDYAPIPRGRYYAATCDDPGLGKPAFLAAKNAEFPVQSEVDALDYYIGHFVWGGLQRTTNETYPYAIYGIPDWKTNRDSSDPGRNGQLHIWREYDYPHVIQMYFAMYRLAKNYPEIKTALSAQEYLQRAYGTANAFFTVPHEVWPGWSPYGTGFYNEGGIVDLIAALDDDGMKTEADTLSGFWERKVRSFVSEKQDLFQSEYAFDSTGFESTHALAKYAMLHPDMPGISRSDAKQFMENQIAANIFCRGWVEPAYYYLGSDYRGGAGNAYVLTYMSQMGGWSVLDYALNFATNPAPYLRLGYASYLSAWALVNSGTPESNYGYWYPGKENDGGAGGGFEPSANGRMWLAPAQPLGRGSWFFASEIDLGYCGALRTATTVLADDPIFGRFCFGGDWRKTRNGIEVIPKDGLRRRFDARLDSGTLSIVLENDRFASAQPITLKEDLSEIRFQLETDNPSKHVTRLEVSDLPTGKYVVCEGNKSIASFETKSDRKMSIDLPMKAFGSFAISKK